jgi:hypothetical protein
MLGYQIIEFMLFVLLHRCMLCPIESFVMRFVVFYCVFVCLMCSSSLNSVDRTVGTNASERPACKFQLASVLS